MFFARSRAWSRASGNSVARSYLRAIAAGAGGRGDRDQVGFRAYRFTRDRYIIRGQQKLICIVQVCEVEIRQE